MALIYWIEWPSAINFYLQDKGVLFLYETNLDIL